MRLEWLPPHINLLALPAAEQRPAWWLVNGLRKFGEYVFGFEAALELFDFSGSHLQAIDVEREAALRRPDNRIGAVLDRLEERMWVFLAWQRMAARDGAFQIFHVGHVMRLTRDRLRECPVLMSHVDHGLLREAVKLFESYFPHNVRIRDAAGHDAELKLNFEREAAAGHDLEGVPLGKGGRVMLDVIQGRTAVSTIGRQVLAYEVSTETLDRLVAVMKRFYAGFQQAAERTAGIPEGSLRPR